MSEGAGTAEHGTADAAEHTPGQGQEALPVEEKEQPVTRTVESAPQTEEEALVLTSAASDGAAPAQQTAPEAGDDAAPAAPRARTGSRAARTRAPKQDAVLTEAVALAREAVVDSPEGEAAVGEHLGVVVHEDRLLTHLFECRLRGYPGWTWYATVARAPRTKHVTVCESGLIAGPDSLLAPDWVPWEERMQAMNEQEGSENSPEDAEGSDSADGQTGAEPESTEPTGTQSTDAQPTDTEPQDTTEDREHSEDGASS